MNAVIEFQNEMRSTLARIEAKMDMLLRPQPVANSEENNTDIVLLSMFTTKQHAIIQMLARDASTEEIAHRLRVSSNTIKTHLTMIGRKIGVNRRAAIISRLAPILNRVNDLAYLEASGGLPKNWDKNYSEGDPINEKVENKG